MNTGGAGLATNEITAQGTQETPSGIQSLIVLGTPNVPHANHLLRAENDRAGRYAITGRVIRARTPTNQNNLTNTALPPRATTPT